MSVLMNIGEILIREKLFSSRDQTAFHPRLFLIGIMGTPALLGFGMLCYGLFLCVKKSYSIELAFITVGVLLILLSVIALIGFILFLKKKEERLMALKDNIIADVQDMADKIDDQIVDVIRQNPQEALLLSILAGVITGTRLPK